MVIIKQQHGIIKWNRKVHIYLGLYLLLFIWLFGLSGVLLNHHWEFANSWEKRKQFDIEKTILISKERNKHTLAREIMNGLELNGSIYNFRFSSDSSSLRFILAKPGTRYDIQAQLNNGNVLIKGATLDKWNMMRTFHKLRNPTLKEQNAQFPSAIASVWSISMDFISVGLIIICLGGWYMWLQISGRRFYFGLYSIIAGFAVCMYFIFL